MTESTAKAGKRLLRREIGVQVEPEPEWTGPDPLLEMAAKARRMVPASKVAEAVAAERERIVAAVEGLADVPHDHAFGACTACRRDGVLAALEATE